MSHTPEPWELPNGPLTIETLKIFDSEEWIIFPPNGETGPLAQVAGAENAKRIVSCVNACQGMADPAKEIAEMKEALKVSGVAIHDARKLIEEKCEVRGHGERYSAREMYSELFDELDATLAKIQTILKP